ncbi:MAG TPA: energy-coupling factor transporter ATPase [Microbacterium sp.]|nr:energy-coupling factor transporter ATPase [Microbacterium sp.]
MTTVDRDSAAAPPAAAAPEALLAVRDLAITHEGADVATPRAMTFTVEPGEVVLILGPSGSGKSTLALALNGLIPHAIPARVEGQVTVAGIDASTATVAQLSTRVGMVFQDPDAQLITGTLLDEVAFGVENLCLPADEVMRRAEDALRRVGLWDRRVENPDRLSGGARQRLAIACALAMGSPLLVLDEPTANLDPVGIEEVYAALGDVVAAGDRAIVLIEHNLGAAIEFVDRVVVMDGAGCLVHDGPVGSVLREHAAELHALGVWLPVATLAALRLRRAGCALDPLPLTPGELRAALEASPPPPAAARSGNGHRVSAPSLRPVARRPEGKPLITVRGLRVSRRRHEVLHGIDLDIAQGDFLAVVGENGAGKTTLVQAIAGVVPPPRGHVLVDGVDTGRASARELVRHVGFVFQNPENQFIAATVHDELAHALRLRRVPEDEVRARVDDMLERFGLTDKAATHPFLLSGGQKRRLSVGTALIAGPPVLALDEPTFGQDRARADELLGILDGLHREGRTLMVVTHDMQLVAEHATHVAVLSRGRLLAHGRTADVFADRALIESAGLRVPALAAALRGIPSHPELDGIVRLRDLPGSAA